ncbi:MAG: dienelactone hydrolase family protein [Leptolyngbya sp. SIO1D8]|nr:dienelactone hydrolase family protein [Leptolyngbya sp. SIO1D8]
MVHRFLSRLRPWFASLFIITLGLVFVLQACTGSNAPSANAPSDEGLDRMAQEHQGEDPIATGTALQAPAIAVISETVEYAAVNGQPVTGFFAQPAVTEAPLPGIITIHEWWGLNDNIKAMTERLAGEGYSVLAVDLYNGEVADESDQARELVQRVRQNPAAAEDNLLQAYDYLVNEQQATAVGSIGWCFGGAWSLNTGLLLPQDLDAVVIYYGRLETDPAILAPLEMPIAGFFGGQDQSILLTDVEAFEIALTELGKTVEIHIYEEANHAFANPSGTRYNPEAAEDAWEKTTAFFAQTLSGLEG